MEKLTLRKIKTSDKGYFAKWWRDKELLACTSGVLEPISDVEVEKYFSAILKSIEDFHFIVTLGGKVLGHISLVKRKDGWYETQIIVGEKEYWGKGYGTEAIRMLLQKAQRVRISKIFLEVRPTNTRAIAAYKKSGFVEAGIKTNPHDKYLPEVLRMEIRKDLPDENSRNKVLVQDILTMAHRDQQMRKSGVWRVKVDIQNTQRLKQIIAEHGWPTISLVGKAAADGAWLLAQHADLDVKFQKRVLALMKKAAKRNEADADRKHIAYLIDRVRVNMGRPQIYGTQFFSKDRTVWKPRPIEKPKHLDARRAEMGMQPFVEYEALLRRTIQKYGRKKK